jgi:anti-anti-sigma factor
MPTQRWSDRIWLVTLSEEPALSEDLTQVRDDAARAEPPPDVVVDFTGIDHINSSNLSQLLRLRKHAVDRDAKLRLTGLSDAVWAVFLTTGLD